MKNTEEESLLKEVIEVISDGQNEIKEEKKVTYDKTTKQYSIKLPKSIVLKSGIQEYSTFEIILNPKESKEKIQNARFIIYLKEDDNDKGKKAT